MEHDAQRFSATIWRRRASSLRYWLASIQVATMTRGWSDAPVAVVPSASDLPDNQPPDVIGLFSNHRVYVVSDQPSEAVCRTVAHEAIGHLGVRRAFGRDAWRHFALAVCRAGKKGGDTFLRALRQRVRSVYCDRRGRPCLSPASEGDEILGAAAEAVFDRRSGRILVHNPLRKALQALAAHLARRHLRADVPVDSDQVEGALVLGEHALRYGGLCWGVGPRTRRLYNLLSVAAGIALLYWGFVC